MALPFPQVLHVPLGGTIDGKTARLVRGPHVLRHVYNARQDQHGQQSKRRGFTRYDTSQTIYEETPEAVFVAIGTAKDCLVIMGFSNVYTVAANADVINGSALVQCGPSVVGCHRLGTIKVAALRREA